jgi:hypothetical protein
MYGQQYGWGGKRSEVEVILDGRDNAFDSAAWYYHKMNQGRQGSRGCGCGGSGCQQCWSPATAWFDYNRAAVSYMKDVWDCLYGRNNQCGPSWCPPACPPPCPDPCAPPFGSEPTGKIVASVSIKQGGAVVLTFKVFNKTCYPVKLPVTVNGFWDAAHANQWVVVPAADTTDLAPGETRTIHVNVNAAASRVQPQVYDGTICIQTLFNKVIALEVQVSA